MNEKMIFAQIPINVLGDALVEGVAKTFEREVSILMFLIDDETGEFASTTNLAPEQVGEFLDFARAQHRTGAYSVAQQETKQ